MRDVDTPNTAKVVSVQIGSKVFAPPALSHRNVVLRPMQQSDYEFVRQAETCGQLASRWRFRGGTPSPEQWMQQTWSGVLAHFLVFARPSAPPLGIVSAYEPHHADGHAKIAAARFVHDDPNPAMVVALALLVRHVFAHWDLRKLYMDVPEYNLPQFSQLIDKYFQQEARLIDHIYFGGERWDQITLALFRRDWAAIESHLLPDS